MSTGRRLLAFAATLVLALLVAEGALALVARRSLAELLHGPRATPAPRWHPRGAGTTPAGPAAGAGGASTEAAGGASTAAAVAGGTDGDSIDDAIFAADDNPLVGYTLKPEAELSIYDGRISTDRLGMRRRPGPPPPADAFRIVVLGDSIAFGFGVNDDECLAARLEARLAELRGPGERPVVCRTIAVPSWNHRAAPAFLLDHWDELRADLVLYLPCRNDVCDTDGATPEGRRRVTPDCASSDPWLSVSVRTLVQNDARKLLVGNGGELGEPDLGEDALFSDRCAESRRRHDDCARSVVRLSALLEERGCRLAVVWNSLSDYTWFLSERLLRLAPELPAIALLRMTRKEFTLGFDPHPNVESLDVWARWLAAELVERGWVSRGEGRALPPVPQAYLEERGEMPAPAEVERLAAEARERSGRMLRPDIDFRRGLGLLQVIGGLNVGRTARQHLLVELAPVGDTLELDLEPIASRPDLYPLAVEVEVNDALVGTVTLRSDELLGARLRLPEGLDRSQPLQVALRPESWIVRRVEAPPGATSPGPMILDWCRPGRIATSP